MNNVRKNEKSLVKIKWTFEVRDAKTGKLIDKIEKENVVTDGGKEFIASTFLRGHQQTTEPLHWVLVLGTGSGTPAPTDTNLWSPVDASEKTGSLTYSANIIQYYVRYLPEDANGYTYTEAGIYDGIPDSVWSGGTPPFYPNGTLINHVLIDPAITKTSDILVDVYIQLQFT